MVQYGLKNFNHTNMAFSLKGKTAIITGGGSGIGKAISTTFSEQGAHVCIIDFNEDNGNATVSEIEKSKGTADFYQCDVANQEQIEGIISEIKEAGTEEEEAVEEEVIEEVVEEELATETATPKKVVKSISEETFFSEIEKLRNEINELKLSKVEVEEVVELSAEKVELSEVEGISHNPENVSATKELNLYSQKGKNTVQNRIFNIINK